MKHKYNTYEMQRVNLSDVEIDLPEETFCFQEWNYRTQYLVKPKFTTWEAEPKIWKYEILVLHSDFDFKIEKASISVTDIERILNRDSKQVLTTEEKIQRNVLNYINNFFGDDMTTVENFTKCYNGQLEQIKKEFDL